MWRVNGGRPRTVNEALAYPQYGPEGQDLYLSGNMVPTDTSLPVGTIIMPAMGETISSGTVMIAGAASDFGQRAEPLPAGGQIRRPVA